MYTVKNQLSHIIKKNSDVFTVKPIKANLSIVHFRLYEGTYFIFVRLFQKENN